MPIISNFRDTLNDNPEKENTEAFRIKLACDDLHKYLMFEALCPGSNGPVAPGVNSMKILANPGPERYFQIAVVNIPKATGQSRMRKKQKRIVFAATTPMNYIVFKPIADRMLADERIDVWFTANHSPKKERRRCWQRPV